MIVIYNYGQCTCSHVYHADKDESVSHAIRVPYRIYLLRKGGGWKPQILLWNVRQNIDATIDIEYLSLDVRMSSAYLQIFYLWLILSLKISPNNFCKFTKTPVAILRLFMMKDSLEISKLPLQSSLSAHVLWMVVVSIIFLYRKKLDKNLESLGL